jgi:hypothetical protein
MVLEDRRRAVDTVRERWMFAGERRGEERVR